MISILRLNHRRERDKRITTHVALAARALGADEFILTGDKDDKTIENIRNVVDRFGGSFESRYSDSWKKVVEEFKGTVIHLTMYGERLQDKINDVRDREKDLLVVVGGAKVPGELYELADYNIAVTNQPHSEVSSLALFLDRYHEGEELKFNFPGGEVEIHPAASGKDVRES